MLRKLFPEYIFVLNASELREQIGSLDRNESALESTKIWNKFYQQFRTRLIIQFNELILTGSYIVSFLTVKIMKTRRDEKLKKKDKIRFSIRYPRGELFSRWLLTGWELSRQKLSRWELSGRQFSRWKFSFLRMLCFSYRCGAGLTVTFFCSIMSDGIFVCVRIGCI